jgi:hypothetical protein
MHKITPLLLPELQLLKLHSKSKKLGTKFFFFVDLIQSKKASWQLAKTQKTTCNPIVQKSKPENLPNLSLFLSVSPSLSLSLKKKLQTPTPKSLANSQDSSASASFFLFKLLLVHCPWQFLTLPQ